MSPARRPNKSFLIRSRLKKLFRGKNIYLKLTRTGCFTDTKTAYKNGDDVQSKIYKTGLLRSNFLSAVFKCNCSWFLLSINATTHKYPKVYCYTKRRYFRYGRWNKIFCKISLVNKICTLRRTRGKISNKRSDRYQQSTIRKLNDEDNNGEGNLFITSKKVKV